MITPQTDSHSLFNNDGDDIESEVLAITSVTSEKFVAAPNKTNVISDLLIGLKRFRNATRWKAFFHENRKGDDNKNDNNYNKKNDESISSSLEIASERGLNTNLKPTNMSNNAPIASNEVESFLKEVETTLIQ